MSLCPRSLRVLARAAALPLIAAFAAACGGGNPGSGDNDSGPPYITPDSGLVDSGGPVDGGGTADTSTPGDASGPVEGGAQDAGFLDADWVTDPASLVNTLVGTTGARQHVPRPRLSVRDDPVGTGYLSQSG